MCRTLFFFFFPRAFKLELHIIKLCALKDYYQQYQSNLTETSTSDHTVQTKVLSLDFFPNVFS